MEEFISVLDNKIKKKVYTCVTFTHFENRFFVLFLLFLTFVLLQIHNFNLSLSGLSL